MSSVREENQDSVLAVDTVADIQALPRETDTILVRRLDDWTSPDSVDTRISSGHVPGGRCP